ncbi:MAG: class I mannose-6-phosphate isomerase [Gorillibacterium sp.]|nr:class I mannose-6-phosphate isomerase [Gorillibacterium sp.]
MHKRNSTYNKAPTVNITGWDHAAWQGYEAIMQAIVAGRAEQPKVVLVIETYPTVRQEEIISALHQWIAPVKIISAEAATIANEHIAEEFARYLTEDRVFGYMASCTIDQFYDKDKLEAMREEVQAVSSGVVVVIGFGASLVTEGDVRIYADISRWEIQQRYRSGEFGNWHLDNQDEDILRKYKCGYFLEWRMADRLKRSLLPRIDYYLDTHIQGQPRMISGRALASGLEQTASQPFRLVPYFDPGVWGGNWLQPTMNLTPREHPYAWGFDGVPEENSLYFQFGTIRLELPAINLVFQQPKALLGEKVYARFGAEFPIRFDFLDTKGGQNLSLQVHPTTDYIQQQFGMHYTQDESYYILDADPGARVYLGLQDDVDSSVMLASLERAQLGEDSFDAEKYVNTFPACKHDHFLIPAGTIHCSGADCVILEISATPYIFTFKLWDWDRLGLDGKPRPVHLAHGRNVIQWDRTTKWVESELIDRIEPIAEGQGWTEERTGLHAYEFIETRRHWFSEPVRHEANGSVQMLNLVEGEEALVESTDGAFQPFVIRYAETFIIPAAIIAYTIRPSGPSVGKTIATIKAYVRT